MKHLKLFNDTASYEAFKESEDFVLPNVSYTKDGNLYYNTFTEVAISYNMVDLGLPSGLLWADRNVGATSPYEQGLYFAWGETNGYTVEQLLNKEKYFDSNYSDYFDSNTDGSFKKYNVAGATLELSDDAAYVNMGSDWRMPTKSECEELINNTTIEVIDSDEIKGVKFIGKNNNSIFIPLNKESIYDEDNVQLYIKNYCWTSSLFEYTAGLAYYMLSDPRVTNIPRSFGQNVRGVKFNPNVKPSSPNLVCTYNVIDISRETKIAGSYAYNYFTSMIVDGVEMELDTYYQFNTTGLHTVEFILYSPTNIGNAVFQDCSALTEIIIPDSATSIGYYMFQYCTGLTSITCLAPTAPSLDFSAFSNVPNGGVLKVPAGSDYSSWISTNTLGNYNWTIQYI